MTTPRSVEAPAVTQPPIAR